ncbi:MAG: acetylserotonin O-methyltransferase [Desulfosudis oleivorans]|nr:acetylserotonin O-methyltransferase [Desulfosudis oleivorans]
METVVSACGLDRRGGRILLDACVALGLLEKDQGRYKNTPEAALFLVPGSPADLSGAIRYNRDVYGAWGRLKEMAVTGKPVEKPEVHLGQDPDRARTFVLAMHGRALGIGRAVVPRLDLAGRRRVLDVGGGPGTYSVLIAEAHPGLECVVLDLPGRGHRPRDHRPGRPRRAGPDARRRLPLHGLPGRLRRRPLLRGPPPGEPGGDPGAAPARP